jgi:hypothetical protein
MPDVASLLEQLEGEGQLRAALNDPRAQFAIDRKQYWGATVLPIQNVEEDGPFREYGVRWRTVVATDSTRYSPVTLRQVARGGSVLIELGEKDAGAQIFGRDLERIRKALNGGRLQGSPSAASLLTQLTVKGATQPLVEKEEKERLEAMVDGLVKRRGDNGYSEDVTFPNPVGHRVTVADEINDPAINPLEAIDYQLSFMRGKGYPVTQIRTSTKVINALRNNPSVTRAVGSFTYIDSGGQVQSGQNSVTLDQINAYLAANGQGYPPIVAYDEVYETLYGPKRFLREDAMLMVSTVPIDLDTIRQLTGDSELPAPTSLGYYGLGITENQSAPGRAVVADYYDRDRGARISVKSWESSAPVLLESEALSVLNWTFLP